MICTARARSSYHARRASWPVFLKTLATPTRRWRSVVPMHSNLLGKKSYYQRRTGRARHQVHGGAPNSITPSVRPVHTRLGHARSSPSRTSRPRTGGTYSTADGGGEEDGAVHGMAAALGRTSARADGRRPATAAPVHGNECAMPRRGAPRPPRGYVALGAPANPAPRQLRRAGGRPAFGR
jgi:hypothetical protein